MYSKKLSILGLLLLFSVLMISATVHAANMNILFILDGSGSMWGRIDGVAKIVLAKDTMTDLIQKIPENTAIGLISYGHRRKGDCKDIELMVPLGQNTQTVLQQKIQSISPKGKTPIQRSIELAVDQLDELRDETLIVLVSDGGETCDGDPCQRVEALRQKGIRFKMHVIGFDVTESETAQLACIARAGGGHYFSAEDAAQLQDAFDEVKKEIIQTTEMEYGSLKVLGTGRELYEVFDSAGEKKIGYSRTNQSFPLPPGIYLVRLQQISQKVTVTAGEETVIGSGRIRVSGLGRTLYAVYDISGKRKIKFTRINKEIELLAGTYLLELNGVRQTVTIVTGKENHIQAGRITVLGDADDLFEIYDASGKKKLAFTDVNKSIEVLAGTYQVKMNNRWFRNVIVPAGGTLKLK